MNTHRGSSFDAFLEEGGILDEVAARAQKRLFALQLADIMKEVGMNKASLAKRLATSRSQLDRLLDPENTAVTLESMERLAHAVGKQLRIELA
ncbi:MAG: putative integron cassette protein [Magnetococcales bacterium]|nr:putative integron cassette protein [Magnetococcales bacterium]